MSGVAGATETMLYLVGVARAGELASFASHGIEPHEPDASDTPGAHAVTIDAGGTPLDALVVEVPRDLFAGPDAEDRLQDVTWLRPRAERHEAIVRAARARASMMPVGFGGVFSSTDALAAKLADHADAILAFLDETANRDEWSLKAWVSRSEAIERAKAAIAEDQAARPGDGAAYLRARRLEGEAESLAEDHALGLVEGLIEDLGDTIEDATERRTTSVEDDPDRWLIAHVALLIDRDTRAAFDARLDDLAADLDREGLHLELTGPWSPYSFCPPLGEQADDTP